MFRSNFIPRKNILGDDVKGEKNKAFGEAVRVDSESRGALCEMQKKQEPEEEYPHWNRVYAAVAIYTIALILLIWGFSRIF